MSTHPPTHLIGLILTKHGEVSQAVEHRRVQPRWQLLCHHAGRVRDTTEVEQSSRCELKPVALTVRRYRIGQHALLALVEKLFAPSVERRDEHSARWVGE
jgi:hypothetical protein